MTNMAEVKREEGSKFKGLFGKKAPEGAESKAAVEQEKFDNIDRQTEDWRNKQARGYQEHQHCSVCGRAIHLGKKYCSMECKNKLEGVQKKQSKNQKLMCCVMGAVMPIMLVVMFMFQ
jgi:predicted nucleic acid-binding Zn ribbon protein